MTQEPEFQGRIGKTYKDSDPWWPPIPSRHDGNTPNVVVMLFDEEGQADTFQRRCDISKRCYEVLE